MTKKQVQKLRKRVERAWKDDPEGNEAAVILEAFGMPEEEWDVWDSKNYQISCKEYSRPRDGVRAYRRADMSLLARLEAKAKR